MGTYVSHQMKLCCGDKSVCINDMKSITFTKSVSQIEQEEQVIFLILIFRKK